MFYICLKFGSILLVILTSFSWALINTSALLMVSMSDVVQIFQCCFDKKKTSDVTYKYSSVPLIEKMLVNISDVVKNVLWTLYKTEWVFRWLRLLFIATSCTESERNLTSINENLLDRIQASGYKWTLKVTGW